MKKPTFLTLILLAALTLNAQVAINTDGTAADPSAMLEVKSDTAGILIPRMSALQRDAIISPANGLLVYITDDSTFYYYKHSRWVKVGTGVSGWKKKGNIVRTDTANRVILGDTTPQGKLTIDNENEATSLYINNKCLTGTLYGINSIVTGSNLQYVYGTYTKLNGNSGKAQYGNYTIVNVSGNGIHYGNYTYIPGSGKGIQYGSYSFISNNGSGTHYGFFNKLTGSGTGIQYGGKVYISSSGNSTHYGLYSYLLGTGMGTKYGLYSTISSSAGGKHYGVYAVAQGSGNYAGYFTGRMYISDSMGIGVSNPKTKLDVDGTIKVGTGSASGAAMAGTIRWNSTTNDFEGYTGTEWMPLTNHNLWGKSTNSNHENYKIIASDGSANDDLGYSVSIAGDYVVIGAPGNDIAENNDQGSAYIFHRDGTNWTQQDKLIASDGDEMDEFGYSVSIAGDYVIIGVPSDEISGNIHQGSAYIFHREGSNWTQQAKLNASDGEEHDEFGYFVSLDGDYAIIGAPYDNISINIFQGSAYIFHRDGINWTQQAKLTASDGDETDEFGYSVSIAGNYAIIGSPNDDISGNIDQGSAYIFHREGSYWTQQDKLNASDGEEHNAFGCSVSIAGNYVIIGATGNDIAENNDQGSAYIFHRSETNWTQQAKLTASDGDEMDIFGCSVSIAGDYAIIGATGNDIAENNDQGSAYIFHRSETNWTQQAIITASDGDGDDYFGYSVSIAGDYAIIGVPNDDIFENIDQGSAYFIKK